MKSTNLIEKVYAFTDKNAMFPPPSRVLVAVSGGADSLALLSALRRWPAPGLTLAAVHVHHAIRGAEADRDAAYVVALCRRWGVPLFLVRADVPTIAKKERIGLEEAGRLTRYAIFERLCDEWGGDWIATAHTASDQAETVLMNLLRGCGVSGLCGIPARRGRVVRPLLSCTREEIESYCEAECIPFVIDSTNENTDYRRNAVRHAVLPAMREAYPEAERSILRLSTSATEDEACLTALAQKALEGAFDGVGYERKILLAQPTAVRYRMVRLLLADRGCRSMERVHFQRLEDFLHRGQGAVPLPEGWTVRVSPRRLTVQRTLSPGEKQENPERLAVSVFPFSGLWNGRLFSLSVETAESNEMAEKVHRLFFKYTFDCDTIHGSLYVRGRLPGERMRPAGRGVGKPLAALMQEAGIPAAERDAFPILCDEDGPLLLPGVTCADRARFTAASRHFLVWNWTEQAE